MKIVVLMSTYNGERYVKEQLDSIIRQTVADDLEIYIRDDGSNDKTIPIIETYINDGSRVNIVLDKGENIGVKASFFELIKNAPKADYYAFSDQDDVWLEKKLQQAVEMISAQEGTESVPILYCSDAYLVDDDLNIIKRENKNPRPSFGNALVENICTGCTAVMNRALLEKIQENIPNPEKIIMHDWWFYLIAELYGTTIFDNEPQIYYRQHGNNEWGVKTSRWVIAKYRFKQLFAERGQLYRQLGELERINVADEKSIAEKKSLIEAVLATEKRFLKRIELINNKKIYRNDRSRDRVYRLALLIGKL